jgi:chromosome segregation ATPase
MSISEAIRNWLLEPVMTKLTNLQTEVVKIMATQQDLDAALTALGTVLSSVQTLVTSEDTGIQAIIAAVAALIAKINSGGDFTNEVTAINSIASQLTAAGQDIQTQTAAIQASLQTVPK